MMKPTTALLLLLGISTGLRAGEIATSGKNMEAVVQPVADEKSIYDKIWGLAVLYKNDEGFLQELALTGRQQNEWFYFEDTHDDVDDSDWINRRTRVGLKAKFAGNITVHSEVDLDLQ